MASPRPIIVGTGIAGLWTAWRLANEGQASVLVTKGVLADSASAWAQGGVAVALGPGDSPSQHAADTLAAGDGLSDPEAVRILTKEGPDRIRELLEAGAIFDRGPDGSLRFGLEAAHTQPRIIHAGGDRTGAAIVAFLTQILRRHPLVEILRYTEVAALGHDGSRLTGVIALRNGQPVELLARDVVLATGGVGQLYGVTTNPLVASGDGWALAWRVGAELRDIEFLQFHPTALKLPGVNPAPLITEAVRGAGGILVDRNGRRFAFDADPRGELAPRDVVARAVAAADATGGAWLDAREIRDFPVRFPGVTQILATHGLDPARDLIPVAPALHYAMGGIRTDFDGRSTREGLWAVGEVARTGVHGANRLASNSLLEGMVFADRVARALVARRGPGDWGEWAPAHPVPALRAEAFAARWRPAAHRAAKVPAFPPAAPRARDADESAAPVRDEIRAIMTTDVGMVRTESGLRRARRALTALTARLPADAWRTHNMLLVARLITHAALRRRESRGGHRRLDYPPAARPATPPSRSPA
ncbi:MAG: FAD-dependent oxidoreductase [Gemmatimonadetes bacterium]|nr:FAD-dependent oxidoreductase [Gemmatimonadota bacterium]